MLRITLRTSAPCAIDGQPPPCTKSVDRSPSSARRCWSRAGSRQRRCGSSMSRSSVFHAATLAAASRQAQATKQCRRAWPQVVLRMLMVACPSLRAKRSNPCDRCAGDAGLLRFARNDGERTYACRDASTPAGNSRNPSRGRGRPRAARGYRPACGWVSTCGGRALFHDPAMLHHGDVVADLRGDAQIVGDEQQRDAEPVLDFVEQFQHLRLHRDVERRDRFVRDQHVGIERQRARNRDALALAAGELVRIARDRVGAAGRPVRAVRALSPAPRHAACRN